MKYPIQVIGINYRSARLSEVAKVQWPDQTQADQFLNEIKAAYGISEAFFLCTCNRREFYFVLTDREEEPIDEQDFLDRLQGSLGREFDRGDFFRASGKDAVMHLFRVAASLESMVLGETEITKQIRDQAARARKVKMTGRYLNAFITEALKAAKCVRTRTAITKNVVSMSSLTYRKVVEFTGGRREKTVVFLGAGHFMRSIMPHFAKAEMQMIFVNRTRPDELAAQYGGKAICLSEFMTDPEPFDALVSATAAPHHVITHEWVSGLQDERPRLFIDLAVPRDIDPGIDACQDQRVQSLGQMQAELQVNRAARETEIPKAFPIFEESLTRLEDRMMELRLSAIHAQISAHYRHTGDRALDHLLNSTLEGLSEEDTEKLKRFTQTLVSKLVTVPILGLKGVARTHGRSGVDAYTSNVAASTKLFGDRNSSMIQ